MGADDKAAATGKSTGYELALRHRPPLPHIRRRSAEGRRMKIAMVAFEGFTDVDLFLPWDLFYRVKDATYAAYGGEWDVRICADAARVRSYSGLAIDRHEPLEWANGADAVFVVSGPGSRAKIKDAAFLAALQLDPSRQLIAAIDSGALILAALGLLDGLTATTYPSIFAELEALGVKTERKPFVVHGNVATGGGCLATQDLAAWIVERLIGKGAAVAIVDSVAKVG
jgi:transcriptional regulator GlxA family with amidase domain